MLILPVQFMCWPGFDNEKEKRGRRGLVSYPFQLRNSRIIWSVGVREYLKWQVRATQLQNETRESEIYHRSLQPQLQTTVLTRL